MLYVAVLGAVLIVTMLLGVPIAFALLLSAAAAIFALGDISVIVVAQQLYSGMDGFLLLAIPLFLLAGDLMALGGLTDRLLDFTNAVFGRFRGGLAVSNVAAATVMAGISGSAVADTGALGKVMIPSMVKSGYDRSFAAALTAAANVVGPIIPPSITFIIISVLTNLSPLRLFIAAVIPGLLYSGGMVCMALYLSRKRGYPKQPPSSAREIGTQFVGAFWAVIMPIWLIGGIRLGFFNVTESSAFAVLYAFVVGRFIYRELTFRKVWQALVASARTTAIILIILGCANLVAWLLAYENAPGTLGAWIQSVASSPIVFLLMVNVLLVFIGTFMENAPALVMLMPVLFPISQKYGIDPYHFSMIMGVNLLIGLITPPVALCSMIAGTIAEVPFGSVIREGWPFYFTAVAVVLLVTYIPALSLWLPNLIGGY